MWLICINTFTLRRRLEMERGVILKKLPIFFLFVLLFVGIRPITAQNTTVVGTGSPQSCTEASFATALEAGGMITFNCGSQPHTLYLKRQHVMQSDTNIDGGNQITLDGGRKTGLLASENHLNITLQNITLQNGKTHRQGGALRLGYWNSLNVRNVNFYNNIANKQNAACDGGGAIFIGGGSVAHISASRFEGNRAQNGGAINNLRSGLTIVNSHFNDNHAQHSAGINRFGDCGGGGAVYVDATRKPQDGGPDLITLRGNTFTNNTTNNHGGALFVGVHAGEHVEVSSSYFANNRVTKAASMETSGTGGAIWYGKSVRSATGNKFMLARTAFIDNHADTQGGGVWTSLPMTIRNSTFHGNTAVNPAYLNKDDWRKGNGGGIAVAHKAIVQLENSTIVGNRAGFNGGGVVGENITARNTIIGGNSADWYLNLQQNCTHALKNWGNNIQYLTGDDPLHRSNCGASMPLQNPLLGQLSDGVLPLLPNSPAIDAGNLSTCPTTDQRGVPRARGKGCDIGAYER